MQKAYILHLQQNIKNEYKNFKIGILTKVKCNFNAKLYFIFLIK